MMCFFAAIMHENINESQVWHFCHNSTIPVTNIVKQAHWSTRTFNKFIALDLQFKHHHASNMTKSGTHHEIVQHHSLLPQKLCLMFVALVPQAVLTVRWTVFGVMYKVVWWCNYHWYKWNGKNKDWFDLPLNLICLLCLHTTWSCMTSSQVSLHVQL